jgi:hypothetical protein
MTSKTYRKQVGIAKWSLGIVLVFGLLTAPAVRAQCEQAKLTASDASADDLLGRAVSIDGDLLVVGARTADTSELASGAAYVFRNTQNGWIEEQKLAANDPQSFAAFGTSVSISDDIIVVGARRADQAHIDSGAAYVFRHNGTSWIQEAKLVPDTGADLDQFGSSVGIAGNYVVLGAPGHDSEASDAGAAYIFWYNGSMWVQQTKLVASNPGLSDGFGWRVALGGDLAVVTSPLKQAAYVFRRQGSSWPQESILTPNEATTADDWIEGVSVDGDMVVLGYIRVQPKPTAARVSSVLTGAAYVFHHDGISWSQVAKLTPSTATDFAYFGISVGLSKNRIVVGAEQDDVPGSNRGSAFVFKRSGSIWNEEAKIVASDGMTDDLFGQSTAIDDTFLVVGAPNNDHACPQDLFCNSGAAYVYWLKSSPACEEIPAVSLWSMVALCLLLLCGATIGIRNRVVPRNVSCPLIGVLAMSIVSSPIYAQLHQRTPLPKVDSLTRPEEPNRLEIKFRDDLKVRASDGNITSLTGSDISDVLAVRTDHALTFEQLIILPQTDIDTLEAEAAKISGFAQPDLAGMMIVRGGDGIIEIAGNELLALDQLEWAQFVILQSGDPSDCAASTGPFCVWEEPESFCPADTKTFPCDACDVAAPTCDYFADRGSSGIKDYHAPDPGINMAYAWATNTASRGACVRIADIENAFRRGHEDLCVILEPDNQPLFPVNSLDHGTAVLGEIVAADNGYGWTGLAPEATAWFFSKAEIGTLTAMVRAQLETEPGDIVLLEVGHPAELDDAIWTTTCTLVQSGRIVVTPAGNSAFGLDLDSSQFENYRSRVCGGIPSGDSGAIIVGAGTADLAHTRNPQSGYGARVNLQGWGDDVTTLGGGDLDKAGVGDEAYTNTFSNTSAATPFVAAAAVALQGIAQDEFGGARLTAMQIRKLLGDTGTS